MQAAARRAPGSGTAPTATICTASGGSSVAASLASCTASSRVGAATSTFACAEPSCAAPAWPRRARVGSRNASDLPLPVSACNSRLSPACTRAIAARWIGVGVTMLLSRNAATAAGSSGSNSAKSAAGGATDDIRTPARSGGATDDIRTPARSGGARATRRLDVERTMEASAHMSPGLTWRTYLPVTC